MSGRCFKIIQEVEVACNWNKTDLVLIVVGPGWWIGTGLLPCSLCLSRGLKFSIIRCLIQRELQHSFHISVLSSPTSVFAVTSLNFILLLILCYLNNFHFPYCLFPPFLWLMYSRQKILFSPEHFCIQNIAISWPLIKKQEFHSKTVYV